MKGRKSPGLHSRILFSRYEFVYVKLNVTLSIKFIMIFHYFVIVVDFAGHFYVPFLKRK